MPLNGSGTMVPAGSSVYPAVTTTTISSTDFNALTADLVTALSTAIYKDGQSTPTANIPMGGFKLTGLANGTLVGDATRVSQVQNSSFTSLTAVAGTNTITATATPTPAAYVVGQVFNFTPAATNTSAATLNVSSLGGGAVQLNGAALLGGELRISVPVEVIVTAATPVFEIVGNGSSIPMSVIDNAICDFRLTLTTGTPVTTADVTGAGTLYASPYTGNRIALFDGTNWNVRTSAEFSLALTLTSGKPYDIFCYDNAGVPTIETLVWTNDTTRATALTLQNGVLVKTGATTRRYLGTLYASGANTTEDSLAKRYLWNYYNRASRPMRGATETANTWTYTSTWRQANANAANQLDMVIGVSEDAVSAQVIASALHSVTSNTLQVGIGLDATNAIATGCIAPTSGAPVAGAGPTLTTAQWRGFPGVGRHFLAWLESTTAATVTFYGDNGDATLYQAGIAGEGRG